MGRVVQPGFRRKTKQSIGMIHFVESPHRKIKNNPYGMIHFVESPHRKIKIIP